MANAIKAGGLVLKEPKIAPPKTPEERGRYEKEIYNSLKEQCFLQDDLATTCFALIRQRGSWFRIVGKSALIFNYDIAPKIGYRSKLYKDKDYKFKVEGGIINVRDVNALANMLIKNHYALIQKSVNFLKFNAGKEYSPADIDALMGKVRDDWNRVNTIFVPHNAFPLIYRAEEDLLYKLYNAARKMDVCTREMFGLKLVDKAREMIHDYVRSCNTGELDKLGFFERVIDDLNWMNEELACLAAVRGLSVKRLSQIGYAVEAVRLEVTKHKPRKQERRKSQDE